MNTSNLKEYLHIGQVIKNYKELCKILHIEVKSSNAKKAQLKELARYFKWHKDGNKFVIDEIYDTPLPKQDNRGKNSNSRNHNIYGKYIDAILLDYFSNNSNSILYETTNIISCLTGLINNNYSFVSSNKNDFYKYSKKFIEFNQYAAWDFFSIVKSRLKDTIRYSLNRLQKKGYIDYKEVYILSYQYEKRPATSIEEVLIKDIDEQVCEELDIKKKNRLQYNDKLAKKYYDLMDKWVKQSIADVDMIYRGYEITINKKDYISSLDLKQQKQELNTLFISRVMNKLQNIYNKNESDCSIWGKINSCANYEIQANYYRSNKSYIKYGKYMCNLLLNINQKDDIKKEIREIS